MTKESRLTKIVEQFIADQEISHPEDIYQSDRVIINAYEFIEELCNVVGYLKDDEDEL